MDYCLYLLHLLLSGFFFFSFEGKMLVSFKYMVENGAYSNVC